MAQGRGFQRLPAGLQGIDVVVADSNHAFGRHFHDEFGIGLIERGAQRSASGRGIVEAGPGDLITVNPGEVHDGRPIDAAGRRWRMLYIDPARLLDAAQDAAPGAMHEFTLPVLRDPRLAQRFLTLFQTALVRDDGLRAEAALLDLVAGLLQPVEPKPAADVVEIAAARERIDDDPSASPTLAELAHACGLSRYQFLRAFKRLTGLPPHAYLLQRRLQRARQLLRGGQSAVDTAAACGFADQSHMTRSMVRCLGLTPGAFSSR